MHGVAGDVLRRRSRVVCQGVCDGDGEHRQRCAEILAARPLRNAQQRVGRRDRRVDHVEFERAESQQESGPLEEVVAPRAGLHIAQQKVKRQQQEEAAHHLVVDATPAQGLDGGAVEHPEDGGEEPRPAESGEPRADGRHQRQVGELRSEDDDLEGQRVQSEEAEPQHEKCALAQRADGSLRLWSKHRQQKIVEVLDVDAGAEPGEIVRAEPRREAAPVEGQTEQRRTEPEDSASEIGGARHWLRAALHGAHLLSRPMFNTMIPSSRLSAPLGGMALSNWKSTRTVSPVNTLAGMSRT